MPAEAASVKELQDKFVEFTRDFADHMENHVKPAIHQNRQLDAKCPYCKVLLTPRNENPNGPYLEADK